MARRTNSSNRLVRDMVAAARALKADLLSRSHHAALSAARDSLAADLNRDVSAEAAADVLAQAVVCAGAILGGADRPVAIEWLSGTLSEWEQWVVRVVQTSERSTRNSVLSTQYSAPITAQDHESPHLYDQFLDRKSV